MTLNNSFLKKASEILQEASDRYGVKASLQNSANYNAYFTRDTVINALGLFYAKDYQLVEGLVAQLHQIKRLQGPNGEIPSNFSITNSSITACSFGTLTPKIDGICWYIIAVAELVKKGILNFVEWETSIEKSIACLDTLEYNKKGLIYAPVGSDWADEYILSGYVLHIQVLRLWALKAVNDIKSKTYYVDKFNLIRNRLESEYLVYPSKELSQAYFNASISPTEQFEIFDFASIVIYSFVFKDDLLSSKFLNYLYGTFISKEILPPVFSPTINESDENWHLLRRFELFGFKNIPGHYHNGGIWWVWLGWYANALRSHNRNSELVDLQNIVAKKVELIKNFEFREYLSLENREGGQGQMVFSAAGISMIFKHVN